jgi:hypothetical protein
MSQNPRKSPHPPFTKGGQERRPPRARFVPNSIAPPPTGGMAIGAAMAKADPAVVRTGGMGAEVVGGLDVATVASGECHTEGEVRGALTLRPAPPCFLLTYRALGLAGEASKRPGIAYGSGRFGGCGGGLATAAKPARQNDQHNEGDAHDESIYRIGSPDRPLHSGG